MVAQRPTTGMLKDDRAFRFAQFTAIGGVGHWPFCPVKGLVSH